jgi:hypothetical protein
VAPIPPAWSPLPTDSSCGSISDLLPSRSSPWGCWATCRIAWIILITKIITLMWFNYWSQYKYPTMFNGTLLPHTNIVQIIWHKCSFQGRYNGDKEGANDLSCCYNVKPCYVTLVFMTVDRKLILQRPLIFHVPNFMFILFCLHHSKEPTQVQCHA